MSDIKDKTTPRKLLFDLIDYKGDKRRQSKAGTNNKEFVYSTDFSPNNIKRVVISSTGVLVNYHLHKYANPNRIDSYKEYPAEFYQNYVSHVIADKAKYTPLLNCLVNPLVCSSIQEIIILADGLCEEDKNVRSIMANTTSKGQPFELTFPRLRQIVVVNGLRFKDYVSLVEEKRKTHFSTKSYPYNDPFFVFAFKEEEKTTLDSVNHQVIEIHKDDWFEHYGSVAAYYDLDAGENDRTNKPQGELNKYFVAVKKACVDTLNHRNKDSAIAESNLENDKELREAFDKAYEEKFVNHGILGLLKEREKTRQAYEGIVKFEPSYDVTVLYSADELFKHVEAKKDIEPTLQQAQAKILGMHNTDFETLWHFYNVSDDMIKLLALEIIIIGDTRPKDYTYNSPSYSVIPTQMIGEVKSVFGDYENAKGQVNEINTYKLARNARKYLAEVENL